MIKFTNHFSFTIRYILNSNFKRLLCIKIQIGLDSEKYKIKLLEFLEKKKDKRLKNKIKLIYNLCFTIL